MVPCGCDYFSYSIVIWDLRPWTATGSRSAWSVNDKREAMSMQVERLGDDMFKVRPASEARRAIHVTRYTPRDQRELPTLVMPNRPEANAVGALVVAAAVLPEHLAVTKVPMMPDVAGSGLHQPWHQLVGSALLLRAEPAFDLSLQRSMSMELLLDPAALPVPVVGDCLRRAAEAVLGAALPETLLRVALHWAFACEVHVRPWAHNGEAVAQHAVSVPEPNRQLVSEAPHRLVVPQAVRVIAAEAVCSRRYVAAADGYDPARLGALERSFVEGFFPSAVTGRPPQHSEVRTALWILSLDAPLDGLGDGGLPTLMSLTFGRRSIGEPEETLLQWCGLLGLRDDHPHGSWGPGQAPSKLRADLQTSTGLDLRNVAVAVWGMLNAMMLLQHEGNQLFTRAALLSFIREALGGAAESALAFACDGLVTTVDQLRDALRLDETAGTGDPAGDRAERRRLIEQHFIERPFVQFDDGTVVPVGTPDAAYGTVEFCQQAHNGQRGTPGQRRQRIGNALGLYFEARVKEICDTLGDHHFVIHSDAIDSVMNRVAGRGSKRADVIVGDADGNYLVIEATKKNLRSGIRYGDPTALDEWVNDHLSKLEQARATAEHLPAITSSQNAPTPREVACLVVGDLPLRQDVLLSTVFDAKVGGRQLPFLCSIIELEQLIGPGQLGWSVPTVVSAWQHNRSDMSLGLFLFTHPAT